MTLDPSSPTLEPFVDAVVRQLRGSVKVDETGAADRATSVSEASVRELVTRAVAGESLAGLSAELAGDVPLLASFFQNVDLLYEHGYPDADAVSGLIMAALERLEGSGGD